jgi:hypothetical protein
MPTGDLAEFILYITPGFIVLRIIRWRYPGKQQSTFEQIAESVIFGVLIVAIVKLIDKGWKGFDLHSNAPGIPDPVFILALFSAAILLGNLLVGERWLRSEFAKRSPKLGWLASSPDSIWQMVNDPSHENWAVVYLKDGSSFLGYIAEYAFDPDAKDQDFLLAEAKRVKDDLTPEYIVNGIGVYLNTKEVSPLLRAVKNVWRRSHRFLQMTEDFNPTDWITTTEAVELTGDLFGAAAYVMSD